MLASSDELARGVTFGAFVVRDRTRHRRAPDEERCAGDPRQGEATRCYDEW